MLQQHQQIRTTPPTTKKQKECKTRESTNLFRLDLQKNLFWRLEKGLYKNWLWEIQISNENGWQINMVRHMLQLNTSKNKWWISMNLSYRGFTCTSILFLTEGCSDHHVWWHLRFKQQEVGQRSLHLAKCAVPQVTHLYINVPYCCQRVLILM